MVNPQRKRMITPDVMLDTRNVMIPVVRPVPVKQSFNIPLSEDRPQILWAQNYKNNPALMFFETPSHTLYNPLRNLLEVSLFLPSEILKNKCIFLFSLHISCISMSKSIERIVPRKDINFCMSKQVKRLNGTKLKNQSTKYTISGKADSTGIKGIDTLQNACPSEESSCNKNDRTLCFPNTVPVHLETSTDDQDLHRASSRSIELSRKHNLPQMKHPRTKCEDRFAILPKIEAQVSNDMSESPIVSLPNQSFYDTDTASTISALVSLSAPSFTMENEEAFANTLNQKSVFRITSNQLQSINSECEINVLHYENDALAENCTTHFVQRCLNSTKTNSSTNTSSAKIRDDNVIDEKSRIKHFYKWEAANWMPLSQGKQYDTYGIKSVGVYSKKPYECKIKYSWQVIGISTQTSSSLLQDLLDNTSANEPAYKMCSIKYSWQIIGIGTQASLHDCHNDPDYWSGVLLSPNKNRDENNSQIGSNETDRSKLRDRVKCAKGGLRRHLILNNQETQTFAEKDVQTDDQYAKYSWHDLVKRYM